jgi:hypothetical protein
VVDDLEAARAELFRAADALAKLLQDYGEQHWAAWVSRDRQRIQDGDASGIDHLLRAYGGMGSLNDLIIHPLNGHHIAAEDIDPVNARLTQLSSRVYSAAKRLKMG